MQKRQGLVLTVAVLGLLGFGVARAANLGNQLKIGNDLFIVGENVTISEAVKGDVYVAGSSVTVDASIGGDLMAAGATVTVNKPVGGTMRAAASTINVNASVGRTTSVAASTVNLNSGEGEAAQNNVMAAGATIVVNQPVKGYLMVGGSDLSISRPVTGEARLAVNTVATGPDAKLAGPVTYYYNTTDLPADVAALKAATTGTFTTVKKEAGASHQPEVVTWRDSLKSSLWGVATVFGFGLLILSLAPAYLPELVRYQRRRPWTTLGYGLLAFPAFLIFIFLGMLTLVFLPLALLLLLATIFASLAGVAAVYHNVGDLILRTRQSVVAPWLSLLLGGVVVAILSVIPVVGVVVKIGVFLWSVGSVFESLLMRWHVISPLKA